MRGLEADLRHALRLYSKTPLASALAVLVLAVAMGFVSAFLSLWSDLALTRLAGFDGARGLVTVGQTDGSRFAWLSLNAIEAINEESSTIASVAGVFTAPLSLGDGEEGEFIEAEVVTRTYFFELQPRVQLGRGLVEDDHSPSAAPVTVISDRFWHQHFGGDPGVIGRTVSINGPPFVIATPEGQARPAEQSEEYRVIGVMAPRVAGTFGTEVTLWLPFEQAAAFWFGAAGPEAHRSLNQVRGLARPANGADPSAIRAELNERLGADREPPLRMPSMRFETRSGVIRDFTAHEETLRQVRLFLAGSVLLAFVAGATVSLFLLSRAPGRQRELAVRMAVGAPLRRLARQLVSEAALLVALGTLAGVLVSVWLAVALREVPFLAGGPWRSVSPLEFRVLGMIAGLMLLLTALVSMAPVLGLKRVGIGASSREVTARAGKSINFGGSLRR